MKRGLLKNHYRHLINKTSEKHFISVCDGRCQIVLSKSWLRSQFSYEVPKMEVNDITIFGYLGYVQVGYEVYRFNVGCIQIEVR